VEPILKNQRVVSRLLTSSLCGLSKGVWYSNQRKCLKTKAKFRKRKLTRRIESHGSKVKATSLTKKEKTLKMKIMRGTTR